MVYYSCFIIIKQMFIHAYQNGKSRGSTNTITTPIMT